MRSDTWLITPLLGDCPAAVPVEPVGNGCCRWFWTVGGGGLSPFRNAKAEGASLIGVPIEGVAADRVRCDDGESSAGDIEVDGGVCEVPTSEKGVEETAPRTASWPRIDSA
jgi:hypothetical protein